MSVLKSWTGGALLLLALAGGLRAEVTVSQSNDPTGTAQPDFAPSSLVALLSQERSGFDSVPASRITAITTAPRPKAGEAPGVLTEDWIAAQPVPAGGDQQFQCLTSALYHEARGESVEGQQAVAEVILNRVDDGRFPQTICGVVHQRSGGSCQFSWACDGRSDAVRRDATYERVAKVARAMLDGMPRSLTDGATFFHARSVRPSWSNRFVNTAEIGAHLFYRRPIQTASN
jgi:spore germination cell wall hydrolase CwlJ-like protein